MRTSNDMTSAHMGSSPHSQLLEIRRDLKAPVHKLFDAFKTAEAIKAWWWPRNIYTDHVEYDFREGGRYFINMKGFDDGSGGMTGEFEEIAENTLIVMTDHFADEHGRVISAKEANMTGNWPEDIYITFRFESLDDNTSRLLLSQQGIPNEMQKDCIQGWSESFDKLEEYLRSRH